VERESLFPGESLVPLPRTMYLPPRRPRFPGPRKTCRRCGLTSETTDRRCPVCATRFPRKLRGV
jgi:hypothetical protein